MSGRVATGRSPKSRDERVIRLRTDFDRVRRRGRRVAGEWVILYVAPAEHGVRTGVVAGRNVGGAVERNRARRLLREAWRELASGIQGPYDVIIWARPEIRDAPTSDVAEEIFDLLTRAGVVRS